MFTFDFLPATWKAVYFIGTNYIALRLFLLATAIKIAL